MRGNAPPGREIASLDHEVKFVLPGHAAGAARALVAACCRPEAPHAASRVESIYFDGPGLESLGEKLASDYRKTKIRLRWYDGRSPVWLEVKCRVGSRREKRRLPVTLDGGALTQRGLDAPGLGTIVESLAEVRIAAPPGLRPALYLTYQRERFVEPASGFRLSIDSEITTRQIAAWAAAVPGIRRPGSGRRGPCLVELKGGSRELPPALGALAALGGRRESFSKYSFCLID